MERLYYTVEAFNGKKQIHIHGEIYPICNGEGHDYRHTQYNRIYLDFEELNYFLDIMYDGYFQVYENDFSKNEVAELLETYYGDKSGTELDILKCSPETPCGDYWCEI